MKFEDGDAELMKNNTVDFVSFSYYMSVCATADPEKNIRGEGNLLGGVPNPTLKASEWGWQIDSERTQIHSEYALGQISETAVYRGKWSGSRG